MENYVLMVNQHHGVVCSSISDKKEKYTRQGYCVKSSTIVESLDDAIVNFKFMYPVYF